MFKSLKTKQGRNERRAVLNLVEAIMNKDQRKCNVLFNKILNKKLGKQISKIANTEDLI